MSVSVWRLCANTIFQKTNLLVVSQKLPLFFFSHYLSRGDLFLWVFWGLLPLLMCARIYIQGKQKKTDEVIGRPVCHADRPHTQIFSPYQTSTLTLARGGCAAANLLSIKYANKEILLWEKNDFRGIVNHSKHPYNSTRFSTGATLCSGDGVINKICYHKYMYSHSVFKRPLDEIISSSHSD